MTNFSKQFYFFTGILAILTYSPIFAVNRLPKFETTRMKGTANAGVASILLDEANYLNPAGMAFYKKSSVYVQKGGMDSQLNGGPKQEYDNLSVIASDAKNSTGGSFSYNTMDYRGQSVKRFSGAIAAPVGEKSSLGSSISYTKAKLLNDSNVLVEDDFKQITLGVTHIVDDNISIGVVFVDPLKEIAEDTRAIAGIQYTFKSILTLMLDSGTDYNGNLSDKLFWRTAAQFTILSDFFLRVGTFNDKGLKEKGSGIGVGWLSPKLSLEVALKNTQLLDSLELNQQTEDIKETSFSLSYRF